MNESILIKFENLHNVRDLGGMVTRDNKSIKKGKLFRSGHLFEASENDLKKLSDCVDVIVDFRTDKEKNEKPDPAIGQIDYYHLPIIESLTAGVTREKDADEKAMEMLMMEPEKAKAYMCNTYIGFVGGDFPISQYEKFVRLLLEDRDKGVLWHCTAGKDRAGFASVIVEEILGVERDVIKEDYLKTNVYLKEDIKALVNMLQNMTGVKSEKSEEALKYLFGAEPDYLDTLYKEIDDRFGSFENFITFGLHISKEEQRRLKDEYLE